MKSLILNIKNVVFVLALAVLATNVDAMETQPSVIEKLKNLESTTEGRLGIFAINTQNGNIIEYRADEIFPTGCTSKVIGVSAILKKSMSDPSLLSTKVKYSKNDLTSWSPITEKHVDEGMTVQELCAASISFSDNTAMNFLLKYLGGVQGMNVFARSIKDTQFSQDNDWPAEAYSGGVKNRKDASTPKAMVESLQKLTLGNALNTHQRGLLLTWLKETVTGKARIKSSVPKGWIVGNKTGTGGAYGTTNDLAIIWPTKHEPLLIRVYYTSDNKDAVLREDVVSTATKLVIEDFISNDVNLKHSI